MSLCYFCVSLWLFCVSVLVLCVSVLVLCVSVSFVCLYGCPVSPLWFRDLCSVDTPMSLGRTVVWLLSKSSEYSST